MGFMEGGLRHAILDEGQSWDAAWQSKDAANKDQRIKKNAAENVITSWSNLIVCHDSIARALFVRGTSS